VDIESRAFRNRLKRELPRWREEGLVDERTEAALFQRYHLGEDGVSVAAATIYTLGALLIGAGVLSFVAWNWEDMARPVKLLLLGTALVAAHGIGFWMWRLAEVLPRLGHALTLLGTLIYGASIGLVAQMFHIHSDPAAGWGLWALGATAAAWALLSVPNASVGVVVAAIWGVAYMEEYERLLGLAPYVATLPFFGLLYFRRSAWLFLLASLAFIVLTAVSTTKGFDEGFGFALATLACSGALLAFSFEPYHEREARFLGVLALVVVAYISSFHEVADEFRHTETDLESYGWLAFVIPLFVGAIVLLMRHAPKLRGRPVTLAAVCSIPVVLLGLALSDEVAATVAANLALVALSFTLIVSAARSLQRAPFWLGSLLAGLVILSRCTGGAARPAGGRSGAPRAGAHVRGRDHAEDAPDRPVRHPFRLPRRAGLRGRGAGPQRAQGSRPRRRRLDHAAPRGARLGVRRGVARAAGHGRRHGRRAGALPGA
jgi:uncharacterized membrane protein